MSDTANEANNDSSQNDHWQDVGREGSEFGAGPVYGCPNCFVMVWIEPRADGEHCPACGFPGEFDELHLIPAKQTRGAECDE